MCRHIALGWIPAYKHECFRINAFATRVDGTEGRCGTVPGGLSKDAVNRILADMATRLRKEA